MKPRFGAILGLHGVYNVGEASYSGNLIRYLGGFLAAYDMTGDELYKTRAEELADLFLPVFGTDSGLPSRGVDVKDRKSTMQWAHSVSLADMASFQMVSIFPKPFHSCRHHFAEGIQIFGAHNRKENLLRKSGRIESFPSNGNHIVQAERVNDILQKHQHPKSGLLASVWDTQNGSPMGG